MQYMHNTTCFRPEKIRLLSKSPRRSSPDLHLEAENVASFKKRFLLHFKNRFQTLFVKEKRKGQLQTDGKRRRPSPSRRVRCCRALSAQEEVTHSSSAASCSASVVSVTDPKTSWFWYGAVCRIAVRITDHDVFDTIFDNKDMFCQRKKPVGR